MCFAVKKTGFRWCCRGHSNRKYIVFEFWILVPWSAATPNCGVRSSYMCSRFGIQNSFGLSACGNISFSEINLWKISWIFCWKKNQIIFDTEVKLQLNWCYDLKTWLRLKLCLRSCGSRNFVWTHKNWLKNFFGLKLILRKKLEIFCRGRRFSRIQLFSLITVSYSMVLRYLFVFIHYTEIFWEQWPYW